MLALLVGCAGRSSPDSVPDGRASGELVVFAAASLTEGFTELGTLFENEHPGSHIVFNFAGSQQLAQQLGAGAPADVFASANATQMDAVIQAGRIDEAAPQQFARNRLVVIVPRDSAAGIETLQALAAPGHKLILATEAVPVGQYSLLFLDQASQDPAFGADFKAKVLANVVSYEENVRAVLSKVALGEADAGIVYTSDVPPDRADALRRLDIPDALNVVASYPIAPLADSAQPDLARAFVDTVLSAEGQQILERHGFIPVNP